VKLFLDTSGLLSVFDQSDGHHSECSEFWKDLFDQTTYDPIISDYILDELTTRIRYNVSHAKALQVLEVILQLVGRGRMSLIWIDQSYFQAAQSIFTRYDDQEFSFTDCTSFAICQRNSIQDAFALDHDFNIFGLNIFPN